MDVKDGNILYDSGNSYMKLRTDNFQKSNTEDRQSNKCLYPVSDPAEVLLPL